MVRWPTANSTTTKSAKLARTSTTVRSHRPIEMSISHFAVVTYVHLDKFIASRLTIPANQLRLASHETGNDDSRPCKGKIAVCFSFLCFSTVA